MIESRSSTNFPTAEQLVKENEQNHLNSLNENANDNQVCLTPGCVKAGKTHFWIDN